MFTTISDHEDKFEFARQIEQAVYFDDVNKIKTMLEAKNYPKIGQDQKEKHIFAIANNSFFSTKNGEKVLKYLIFEYNISEKNSLDYCLQKRVVNDELKEMFKTRKLNEELNQELPTHTDKDKKLKL